VDVLIADQKQVTELLPMEAAIPAMREALLLLQRGDVLMPLRSHLALPGSGNVFAMMPSYAGEIQAVGAKVMTGFPANYGSGLDTHQGVVLLFETERGLLRAVVDATALTAIRTAAVSGVATDLLARPDAGDLALIGAGTQAHTHLQAMGAVRRLRRIRVFAQPRQSAVDFAARQARLHGLEVEVAEGAREAVAGADLVCTVTTASEPVLLGEWVAAGAHVNAVGAYLPDMRELDSALVARARLYADRRESLVNEAGEFVIPRSEGLIDESHIVGEVGEVLAGAAPGRTSPDEVTLFKSLGIAIEDLVAARQVYERARERGAGTWLDIGGRHFGSGAGDEG